MSTHYERGRRLEYAAKKRLEEQGWTVFRMAGSKSPCDLIATRKVIARQPGEWRDVLLVFVQVKAGQRPMPRREREAFATFAKSHGARPLLVTRGLVFNWLDKSEEAAA